MIEKNTSENNPLKKTSSLSQEEQKKDTPSINTQQTNKLLEPTRFGDWEKAGRCYDF